MCCRRPSSCSTGLAKSNAIFSECAESGGSIATRKAAAVVVQRIAREMRSESRQLAQVLKDLEYSANALKRAAKAA